MLHWWLTEASHKKQLVYVSRNMFQYYIRFNMGIWVTPGFEVLIVREFFYSNKAGVNGRKWGEREAVQIYSSFLCFVDIWTFIIKQRITQILGAVSVAWGYVAICINKWFILSFIGTFQNDQKWGIKSFPFETEHGFML